MFKTAELGQKLSKTAYHEQLPELRARLVQAQYKMREVDFSIIIIISGNDNIGRSEAIGCLAEWMDPRYLEINAYGDPSDEEQERPTYWRYWRNLPADGRISIFYGSWMHRPLMDRLDGVIENDALDQSIHEINNFEKLLVDDGTLLLKFWLHLSEDSMKKRFKAAEKDEDLRWKINDRDRSFVKSYDEYQKVCQRFVRKTSTAEAPWQIIESEDHRFRNISIGQMVLDNMTKRIAQWEECKDNTPRVVSSNERPDSSSLEPTRSILDTLDLSKTLERKEYKDKLEKYQAQLHALGQKAFSSNLSSVLVFEGWDAGGKGGAIRRLVQSMDPRDYRVVPVSAPTDEELAHHYMWRFWRKLPRAGKVWIFDRSWYGRVLVERVEGFATEGEWRRAYKEINDFEEELVQHGILLQKFWLHIDPEEQLRRFKAREVTPFKQHKICDDDWRNREKWDVYEIAVNEMVQRTSTEYAPWHLIEGNDKRYARVKVIRLFVEALEEHLKKFGH